MIIDCMTRSRTLPPLRTRDAIVEILAQVLEAAGALDLAERDGPQEGDDVLGDLRRQRARVRGLLVHDEKRLDADPGLVGAGEVGDDGRQRPQVDAAGIAALARRPGARRGSLLRRLLAVGGRLHAAHELQAQQAAEADADAGQRPA